MSECFVYITLPGHVQAVTVGKFALELGRNGVPLGRFVYGRRYLQRDDAVEIDPVELRLSEREYQTIHHRGVFGALRDAGGNPGTCFDGDVDTGGHEFFYRIRGEGDAGFKR